ncbi:MAG TPA: DUF1684 domain-containing protein [Gaiellaceae bacterium]
MDELDLLDWRRRVFELYADVRRTRDAEAGWRLWRDTRDELFASHPQSPLPPEERAGFAGLPYFDYDPALRFAVDVEPAEPHRLEQPYAFTRFGRIHALGTALDVYSLESYGTGVYLCFADASPDTYGGGRYVLDTVKGSDLGTDGGRLVVDFNFAYNPSCSYDPRWVCPLAPPGNRLAAPVRGGERYPASARKP